MRRKILITGLLIMLILSIACNSMASSSVIESLRGPDDYEASVEVQSMGSKLIGTGFISLLIIVITLAIYIIPTIVAVKRKHPNKVAIILINIFLGWSFLGWIGALIWACILPNSEAKNNNKYEDLAKLQKLKDEGTISKEEFEIEKQKVLERDDSGKTEGIYVASLVLGICSLLLGAVPIFGLILAIVSLIICIAAAKKQKMKKEKSGLVTAGYVLTILGILLAGFFTIIPMITVFINIQRSIV